MSPWMWVASAAGLIVALVALYRLGRKGDKNGRRPPDDRYPLF